MTHINQIRMRARAKINITLDILGKLPNGYHDMEMIMQTVNLCDYIFIKKLPKFSKEIQLFTNLSWLPTDSKNLAYKAAKIMMEKYNLKDGVYIDITKNIPVAAGLAGGSADCAAILVGLNLLFNINAPLAELMKIGVSLGADVPYCIMRGTALARGIGDELTPLANFPFSYIVLSKPNVNISTGNIFKAYDSFHCTSHPDTPFILKKLKEGDLKSIAEGMYNVLEDITKKDVPIISKIEDVMMRKGALGAVMSGSGPTVFAVFDDKDKASEAVRELKFAHHINQTFIATVYNPQGKSRKK